jgi:hypothetical protein
LAITIRGIGAGTVPVPHAALRIRDSSFLDPSSDYKRKDGDTEKISPDPGDGGSKMAGLPLCDKIVLFFIESFLIVCRIIAPGSVIPCTHCAFKFVNLGHGKDPGSEI